MNHNFCRIADRDDPKPWCYTTDPNVRFDYCDCSVSVQHRRPTSGPMCGTITKPFSFEYTKYDNNASILPNSKSNGNWNADRVFGGKGATPGEVPSQVNLLFGGTQLNNLLCGGTLVSSTVSAPCPFARSVSESKNFHRLSWAK